MNSLIDNCLRFVDKGNSRSDIGVASGDRRPRRVTRADESGVFLKAQTRLRSVSHGPRGIRPDSFSMGRAVSLGHS